MFFRDTTPTFARIDRHSCKATCELRETSTDAIAFYTYVAVDEHDLPHAWIAMRYDGYVDMLFALPAAIGTGAAADLYATVERIATEIGLDRMSAHASRFAEPFFTRRGWRVDRRSVHVAYGVEIPRGKMSKTLAPPVCAECR